MKRETIVTIITYLFILVFLYTGFSKLLGFNQTLFDMGRNPYLSDIALLLAIGIPVVEIVISVLIFLPKTRLLGLVATVVLMIAFTGYVGLLLLSDSKLPCTCGGVFREMSWTQHLFFNLVLTALATWGWQLQRKIEKIAYRSENHAFV